MVDISDGCEMHRERHWNMLFKKSLPGEGGRRGEKTGPCYKALENTMGGRLAQKPVQRLRHGQAVTCKSQLHHLLSLHLGQLFHLEPQFHPL